MALPGDLNTVVITGSFVDTAGSPLQGTITFTPTSNLTDSTGKVVVPATRRRYILSGGTFTSDPLVATDNATLSPSGWAYQITIAPQDITAYTVTVSIPHSPSPVDLSVLAPAISAVTYASYMPLSGGTFTGPVYGSESPVGATELATKGYVDTATTGLDAKPAVRAATTAALASSTYNGTAMTLTATANGALAVDGVTVAVNDRVLVKNEAAQANNGIYSVTATGSVSAPWVLTRAADMNSGAEIPGAFVLVEAGAANTDTGWFVASPGPFTLGTTAIVWAYQSGGLVLDTADNAQPLGAAAPGSTGKAADAGHVHPNTNVINGVTVSGTPGTGKTIVGTSSSAATWQTADTLAIDSADNPAALGPASPGVSTQASPADHVHPFTSNIGAVAVSGTVVSGRVPIASDATHAAWTLPVQIDTTASDIKALAGSAAAGLLTQAAAADHIHPTTGLVISGASASGDLSGTYPGPAVAKIQGTAISSPPGGTTQFLRGDGTWQVPAGGVSAVDWLNVTKPPYSADNTGSTDATTAIQSALNAAVLGGTVYLPAGTYKVTAPLIIPPAVTLLGPGRSLAYDGGSQPMTISGPVLVPSSGFTAGTYNGQSVSGVLAMLGNSLGGYGGGYFSTAYSFTATNASPCVFTATGSSYANGTQVVLSTGTAPTGFTLGQVYYVVSASGSTFSLSATSGGSAINSTSTGSGTVEQEYGSANQVIRNITINGSSAPAGTNGIEAWGPVWGVRLDDVGVYHMPGYGILTNKTTHGTDTTHYPDFWQVTGCHIAASGSDGLSMSSIGDSYFALTEATGNTGNGWNLTGDNIKITACKAEYNHLSGLTIGRGGASRPILVSGFGTDGNYQYGIQLTGSGQGPVVLSGCGLNYDGQNNGAGGNYAALSITGGAHVTATGLHVTTGISGASHLYPQYAIQCPSTFTGFLQVENSEIYGGTAALSLDTTATGTVRFGANVLTGSGDWASQSLASLVQAPSPQTTPQQYAKYWSPSSGTSGDWITSAGQQPRESIPWYAATGSPTIAAGQMLCAVIPVMPGDVITSVGFVTGATAATFGTSGYHWWVTLYTAGGAALIAQSADQANAAIAANSAHLLALGTGAPYTVPAGTYALLGAVMINTGTGGSPAQPTLRGTSTNAVLMGGASDLFTGSATYAATNGSGLGATAPAGPLTLSVATNLAYLGAC